MTLYHTSLRLSWDIVGITRRKWSNSFYVEAANSAAAAAVVVGLWVNALRGGARERVFAYEVYATDLLEGTTDYTVQAVPEGSQRGTLVTGVGEAYEPKTCVSVTIPVAASRPSRKFWRPGLYEGDVIAGQTLDTALVSSVQTAWGEALFLGEGVLRDPDGQAWGTSAVYRLSSRRFGRESAENLPVPPPLG